MKVLTCKHLGIVQLYFSTHSLVNDTIISNYYSTGIFLGNQTIIVMFRGDHQDVIDLLKQYNGQKPSFHCGYVQGYA